MDPSALIPQPDAIPVSWGWFQGLLLITFFLHMVTMNIMVGSGVIAWVNHLFKGPAPQPLSREIGKKMPFIIAFTVNFGVAPLLFLQVLYGQFLYTSSVLMATLWLSLVFLLIIAYYSSYTFILKYDSLRIGRILLPTLTVSIFLFIAFLFSNNLTMMQNPESWPRYFADRSGFLLNLGDPTLIPRYLHFMASALAIGGLSVALFYEFRRKRGDGEAQRWVQYGCSWFMWATLINFPLGFLFLGSLPDFTHDVSTLSGALFAFFLIGSVLSGWISVMHARATRVFRATGWALATVFQMILVRDFTRTAYLRPYFSPGDLEVIPEYLPMILFLITFVAGLALIAWMLKIAAQTGEVQS